MSIDVQSIEAGAVAGRERDRFAELALDPHFDQVVAANRLYLTAAVADLFGTEKRHWALSCLPAARTRKRYSTISMAGQETFAVFRPEGNQALTAHVLVSESELRSFGDDFRQGHLEILPAGHVSGGDDQIEVFGDWHDLAPALAGRPLRTAARAFAARLLPSPAGYARFHNEALADRVLGRA